ncbi:MAG: mevalonate kinase [Alkalispirochaeta sp.]
MSTADTYWAPGKILLFGEHSAVFGYPAVGAALHRGLKLTVKPASAMTLTVTGSSDPADSASHTGLRRFGVFLQEYAPHLPPSLVEITSDVPISSGFGSSAALCTALAQWSIDAETGGRGEARLCEHAGSHERQVPHTGTCRGEVWRRAHELERFFHGTPSGIDTGLAALGGVQAFRFHHAAGGSLPTATALSDTLPPMVVGSVPRNRSTRELVAMVRRRHEENRPATTAILTALGELAEEAIAHLSGSGGSPQILGELAATAQAHLTELNVSSPVIEYILRAGETAGAVGGKLSGAGDGGAFYLVCPDTDIATSVRSAVARVLPPGGVVFVMGKGGSTSDMEAPSEVDVSQQRPVEDDKQARRRQDRE